MTYGSIDQLQKVLSADVFGDRTDSKKAAGRALGTILELISYYLIDAWNFSKGTSIELRVPEYGNSEITHNVEFALHRSMVLKIYHYQDLHFVTSEFFKFQDFKIFQMNTVKTHS